MSEITTWYLEMTAPASLRESRGTSQLVVTEARIKQYQLNRFLYQFVGGVWAWTDKLSWSDSQWQAYAERDNLRTWVACCEGSPAGYYELDQDWHGSTELAYFGLAPNFIGRGLGGQLLSHAIRSAWEWSGTNRVWVHTCTLDHPSALHNYRARGLEIYREKTREKPG